MPTPSEAQTILERWEAIMPSVPVDEFDAMLDIQEALMDWVRTGSPEPIPHLAELQRYGIALPPTDEPPAVLTPDEAADLLSRLRSLIWATKADDPQRREMRAAQREIEAWVQDMLGSLPRHDQLKAWGVWPLDGPTAPAVTPPPPATPSSGSDPDDALESSFRAALEVLDNTKAGDTRFSVARGSLGDLQKQAAGRLKEPIDQAYARASRELQRVTMTAIDAAKQVARDHPQDLDRQDDAWQAVLRVNPTSEEALRAARRLTEAKADHKIEGQLDELIPQAQAAAQADHLPRLNKLYAMAKTWLERAEKSSTDLSPSMAQRVIGIEAAVNKLRRETRRRLGRASTLMLHYPREAYVQAQDYMHKCVPVVVDEVSNQEITTEQFFTRARENYLLYLRDLVNQRLMEVAKAQEYSPLLGLKLLEEVKTRLQDEVLSGDDKYELVLEFGETIMSRESELSAWLEPYPPAAAELVRKGLMAESPVERLAYFLAAQHLHPDYPNLAVLLADARARLV